MKEVLLDRNRYSTKLITILLSMFLFASAFRETVSAQVDNDYWIVVPANYIVNNKPMLTVLAEQPTNVRVDIGATTYRITATPAGQTIPTSMPMIPEHEIIVNRAIHAYSLDSLPFRVELSMQVEEWGEGVWCIPTHSLGKNYRILSYKAGGSTSNHPSTASSPEFAIAATRDNTQLTIDFPPSSGRTQISVSMNRGEAYHINCAFLGALDPTGTSITSTQPVAVFSGQSTAYIAGATYGNALMEQMFPVESWGTLHLIAGDPLALQAGDIFRFVAECDGTQISNDGALMITLDAGRFYETTISGAHEICSTKPIMVGRFTKAGDVLYQTQGGPSMLVIPPVSCYFDSSRFCQFTTSSAVPTVVIMFPTAYQGLVLFDGTPINTATSIPIVSSCGAVQYSYTYFPLSSTGAHTLCYVTPPPTNPYSLYGYYTSFDYDRDENETWNIGYRAPKYPIIAVSNLDFGVLCDTTKTLPIKIWNAGSRPLIIASISGLAAPFTLNGIPFPDTLAPGDSVQGTVTFSTSTPGTYSQTVSFSTNETAACGPPIDTINVRANKIRAAITTTPERIDFGNVSCRDRDTIVTITNTGTSDVTIEDTSFTKAGFKVTSPALPVTISPGASQQLTIHLSRSALEAGKDTSLLHGTVSPCGLGFDVTFTANLIISNIQITGDTILCNGDSSVLIASGGVTYQWNTGDTTASIHVHPPSTTTYSVTITDSANCSLTDSIRVSVVATLQINIAGANTLCDGDSTTLTASGAMYYQWSTGDTTSSIRVMPAVTTSYIVTGSTKSGCSASDTITVTVNALPVADAGADVDVCPGDSVQLNASGGTTYLWRPTAGLSNVSISNPFAHPSSTTTYIVTVTNANGCRDEDTVVVTVNTKLVVTVSGDGSMCEGDSIQLSASGGILYTWSPAAGLSDPNISNPVARPATATTYTVNS